MLFFPNFYTFVFSDFSNFVKSNILFPILAHQKTFLLRFDDTRDKTQHEYL